MEILNDQSFKCTHCKKIFKYNKAFEHFADCTAPITRCVLECGDEQQFKGPGFVKAHFESTCTKIHFLCDECDGVETRATMENHECMSGILQKVKR